MSTVGRRISRLVVTGAAALAFTVAPTALVGHSIAEPATEHEARPCVNGVIPGNPYIVNCNLPPRHPKVRGAAPDAGAIIACRDWPGCLSWYVNNPH
jgi:hypothetical protein